VSSVSWRVLLQVGTFEECGKPGGVQEILIPWSVAGLIILVAGYPVGLFVALYKLRAVGGTEIATWCASCRCG